MAIHVAQELINSEAWKSDRFKAPANAKRKSAADNQRSIVRRTVSPLRTNFIFEIQRLEGPHLAGSRLFPRY